MNNSQSPASTLVLLATGGTIAGRADDAHDTVGYRSAELDVHTLLQAAGGAPEGVAVEGEQLAQLDSKDMDAATWRRLAVRLEHHLARPEVCGAVVTHGTDTLEETAWLLHRVLAPAKPVVLTAAMRPATALLADGPQNLADALRLAAWPGAAGVLAVLNGVVMAGAELRKRHTWRLDAFEGGDAGALARLGPAGVEAFRPWPGPLHIATAQRLSASLLPAEPPAWPWVEIVTSTAAARPSAVQALVAAGVQGLVVAGSGNGTLHQVLATALQQAQAAGVAVRLVSRCADGPVRPADARFAAYASLSAAQARVELMLELMVQAPPG